MELCVLSSLITAFSMTFVLMFVQRVARFVRLTNKIPGPTLWEVLTQHRKHLLGDNLHNYMCKLSEKFEYKPWGLWFYTNYVTVVSDCETMSEIFKKKALADKPGLFYDSLASYIGRNILTINGAEHRSNRRVLNRVFQKSTLQLHQERINLEVAKFVEQLRKKATGDKTDVRPIVEDVISATAVSTYYTSGTIPYDIPVVRPLFEVFLDAIKEVHLRSANPFYYWTLHKFKPSSRATESNVRKRIADAKITFLDAKRITTQNMLYNANTKPKNLLEILALHPADRFEEEGWSETRAFLSAGSDTTAFVLNVTLVLLAMNPEVQEMLFQEAQTVFGTSDRHVEAQDLPAMVYLEMVIKESLRLFPPAPLILKRAQEEVNLNGVLLPKGSLILINIMALHRNPGSFKDPLEYHPGRFSPELSEERHPFAFIPFSSGPRNCPGQQFAMMVLKTTLCYVIRNFRISLADKLDSIEDIKIEMHFTAYLSESPLRFISRRSTNI